MTPEEAMRQQLAALLRGRIDRVRDVLRTYDMGGLSEGKALSIIEDIASGDGDRIVAPGTHAPEVMT